MKKAVAWILIFVGLVAQGISQSETNMAARGSAACLSRIVRAVSMLERRIPYLTKTAEESAMRFLRNPYASIECPRKDQWGFSEELWERAGGLRHIADGKYDTPDNVVILSSGAKNARPDDGKLVIRFEPMTGDPGVDRIVDLVCGWMWCCEYYAACSRLCGRVPPICRSLAMDDAWVSNWRGWSPDGLPRFVSCPKRIEAGVMGREYLDKALSLFARMKEAPTQSAVKEAADYVVQQMSAGHTVGVAGIGHAIIEECVAGLKSDMKGIVAVGHIPEVYSDALKPGDTLVLIAYSGLKTYWADYGVPMKAAGLNVVLSHGVRRSQTNDLVKVFIPQLWDMPDAEVEIPVRPYRMAPLSEISRCAILRMLDEEVAKVRPRSSAPPPNYGMDYFAKTDYAKKIPAPKTKHREWTKRGFAFEMNEAGKWALKGKTGFDYDMLHPLSDKLIAYEKDGRFGLMLPNGHEKTHADMDLICPYGVFYGIPEREYAVFWKDGKYGKMNPETGEPLNEPMTATYPR